LIQLAEHGEQAHGGVDLGGVLVAFLETALGERGEREGEREGGREEERGDVSKTRRAWLRRGAKHTKPIGKGLDRERRVG
jgi:hypothetical protein